MATTKKDYGFRYSFVGKAAFERKTKRSTQTLFQESIVDGNLTSAGLQDYYWIMTYHQNKGVIPPEEIDIPDDEEADILEQMLAELNRWVQHRNKILAEKAGIAETTTAE